MTASPEQPDILDDLLGVVGASLFDATSPADIARLEQIVCNDDQACELYVQAIFDSLVLRKWSSVSMRDVEISSGQDANKDRLGPVTAPPAVGLLSGTFHGTLGSLSSGWPVAYLVATVIFAIGLVIGAIVHVSQPGSYVGPPASDRTPNPQFPIPSPAAIVGRITGIVDCVWERSGDSEPVAAAANQKSATRNQKSLLRLGDRLTLRSGLLEITYNTGAQVILQGPVTYEVESPAGGFLSVGKLTAKLEQRSEVRGQKSEFRDQTFVVRTPTALVTDLGTEFGVEVDRSGATKSHVFRGRVELRVVNGLQSEPAIQLRENESARVDYGQDRSLAVSHEHVDASTFSRALPKRVSIRLFNSGQGLKEGDPDPHWQIAAVSKDSNFRKRPATVTVAQSVWLPNQPESSQWISATGDGSAAPGDAVFTFRTEFQLTGVLPYTAVLRGRFAADNHVLAIRLNGQSVPVPRHGADCYSFLMSFTAARGFVEGSNVLEIDVENTSPDRTPNPMGLRVELDGTVQRMR